MEANGTELDLTAGEAHWQNGAVERAGRELEWSPGYEMADGMSMTYEWWQGRRLARVEQDVSAEDRALKWLERQSSG